jgi:hypothetical protein
MSDLPSQPKDSTKKTVEFFDQYFDKKLCFPSNQVDAIVGFFTKRGFDNEAALSVSTVLLQQSKIDNVNVFQLLDTLKGLDSVQLSTVVTEVLNYNRPKTSTLGFKRTETVDKLEKRNIVV